MKPCMTSAGARSRPPRARRRCVACRTVVVELDAKIHVQHVAPFHLALGGLVVGTGRVRTGEHGRAVASLPGVTRGHGTRSRLLHEGGDLLFADPGCIKPVTASIDLQRVVVAVCIRSSSLGGLPLPQGRRRSVQPRPDGPSSRSPPGSLSGQVHAVGQAVADLAALREIEGDGAWLQRLKVRLRAP